MAICERRSRIYFLKAHYIIDAFNMLANIKHGVSCIALPLLTSLPDNYRVVSVFADWSSRMIGLDIEHESFDVVPDGAYPPQFYVPDDMKTALLDINTGQVTIPSDNTSINFREFI